MCWICRQSVPRRTGRLPVARHTGIIVRPAGRLHAIPSSLPPAAADGSGGVEVDGGADRNNRIGRPQPCLRQRRDAVQRVAKVPDSTWIRRSRRSPKALSSWGSSGKSRELGGSQSARSPKGNRNMGRLLSRAAQAALKVKGYSTRRFGSCCRGWGTGRPFGHRPSTLPNALQDSA